MENFKLQTCYVDNGIDNGITVCNKWRPIAHISKCGNVKFYVDTRTLTEQVLNFIGEMARDNREKFIKEWNDKTDIQKFSEMVAFFNVELFLQFLRNKQETHNKITDMENRYFTTI